MTSPRYLIAQADCAGYNVKCMACNGEGHVHGWAEAEWRVVELILDHEAECPSTQPHGQGSAPTAW
jgi:hypothetical protein